MKTSNRKTWERSDRKLKGFPLIQHRITREYAVVGRNGELWEYSKGIYCAVFTKTHAINKVSAALEIEGATQSGDELVVRKFNESQLDLILSFLRPFKHWKAALKVANQSELKIAPKTDGNGLNTSPGRNLKEGQILGTISPQIGGSHRSLEGSMRSVENYVQRSRMSGISPPYSEDLSQRQRSGL